MSKKNQDETRSTTQSGENLTADDVKSRLSEIQKADSEALKALSRKGSERSKEQYPDPEPGPEPDEPGTGNKKNWEKLAAKGISISVAWMLAIFIAKDLKPGEYKIPDEDLKDLGEALRDFMEYYDWKMHPALGLGVVTMGAIGPQVVKAYLTRYEQKKEQRTETR